MRVSVIAILLCMSFSFVLSFIFFMHSIRKESFSNKHTLFSKSIYRTDKTENDSYKLANSDEKLLFSNKKKTGLENVKRLKENGGFIPSEHTPLVIVLCNKNSSRMNLNNEHKISWDRQAQQIKVMFWSLLLFTETPVWNVVALVDSVSTYQLFSRLFSSWSRDARARLNVTMQLFDPPKVESIDDWRPCSWIKVFLPEYLPQFERVVYIDTDVIFLGPIEELWQNFAKLKDRNFLAVGPEPWYTYENAEGSRRQTAGSVGLNTGVILFDMKKLRELNFNFSQSVLNEKSLTRPRHDQDAVNSLLSKHPEHLLEISSRFNFLPSVCSLQIPCRDCQEKGIVILHGADGSFYSHVAPRFKVIFAIFEEAERVQLRDRILIKKRMKSQMDLFSRTLEDGACLHYSAFTDIILKNL